MVQRNEEKIIIENRFQKCTLEKPGEPLTELMVYYNRDIIKVLQEQASLASPKTYFVSRPVYHSSVHHTWQNHTVLPLYFHSVYNADGQDIMKESDEDVYCTDDHDRIRSSFIDFAKIFTDKTTALLKSPALVTYSIHAVLLNCSLL